MSARVIAFDLPGLPNPVNRLFRRHWAVLTKEARGWSTVVNATLLATRQVPQTPFKKARLTLIRFSSVEPDFDGLVSSFKHIVDGLVRAGVIVNDKPSVIGQPDYRWEKAPRGKGFIRVKVEDLTGQAEYPARQIPD